MRTVPRNYTGPYGGLPHVPEPPKFRWTAWLSTLHMVMSACTGVTVWGYMTDRSPFLAGGVAFTILLNLYTMAWIVRTR